MANDKLAASEAALRQSDQERERLQADLDAAEANLEIANEERLSLLAARDVTVHAVLPGPIDTDMVRDLPIPKTSPESVARGILDGIERGEEEIFPDPFSAMFADSWRTGAAKEFERQNAALVQPRPGPA